MIHNRALRLLAAIAAIVLYANLASFTTKSTSYTESYPAVICPANATGLTSYISLASSTTPIRKTSSSSMVFKKSGNSRLAGTNQAIVIDSAQTTPIAWQARSGVWAGALTCIAPITSQWFIGGTADVTSKGSLTIVNSGLGKALVTLSLFTENGAQSDQSIGIKANSLTTLPLASLAPGSQLIAIHLVPQTGRINAFLIDERGRGLRSLGGDTVNSVANAEKKIVIPAIPHLVVKKKALGHVLRILVPGEVDAQISASLTTTSGSFAPAGIDGRTIPAGKVIEIPLNLIAESGKFSLTLSADRPILASVRSATSVGGKSDFVWSTSATELVESKYSVTGAAPLLIFTGEKIAVEIELASPKGKVSTVELNGTGIVSYLVSENVRTVAITNTSSATYGGALISSKSGYGFAPLVPGSVLTKSSLPRSNIRVLIP